jgi:tRNA(fMet)-specific endonuclease VapC
MAARYLLDTNICIYIRRKRPLEVHRRFTQLGAGEAAISLITYGELMYGAAKLKPIPPHAVAQMQEFADLIEIQPLPIEAGRKYGELRAWLESKGQMIGNHDLWIAAHAISVGLIVVTNNEREFRRLPDLKVENWVR